MVHAVLEVYALHARGDDALDPPIVFIIGYPRTATTGIYSAVCRALSHSGDDAICIYEPFNPEVVNDIYSRGEHMHDRVGVIHHNYNEIPRFLFDKIRRNSRWLEGFMLGNTPYLGYMWKAVLDNLIEYAVSNGRALVVKDVYAWPRLGEIASRYRDVLIVVPVRDRRYVFRSLRWWMEQRRNVGVMPRGRSVGDIIYSVLREPSKVVRYLRYVYGSRRVLRSDNMFGMAYFYKYFYGHILGNNIPSPELLRIYFYTTYTIYENIVTVLTVEAKEYDNVYSVRFRDRLGEKAIASMIHALLDIRHSQHYVSSPPYKGGYHV